MWLKIETMVWCGILLSNVSIMFIRSFWKVKLDFANHIDKNKRQNIDTIDTLNSVFSNFISSFTLLYASLFIQFDHADFQHNFEKVMLYEINSIIGIGSGTFICFCLILFVDWKHGILCDGRNGHGGFVTTVALGYILLPLLNFSITTYFLVIYPGNILYSFYTCFILFVAFINVGYVCDFFIYIRPTYIQDSLLYKEIIEDI